MGEPTCRIRIAGLNNRDVRLLDYNCDGNISATSPDKIEVAQAGKIRNQNVSQFLAKYGLDPSKRYGIVRLEDFLGAVDGFIEGVTTFREGEGEWSGYSTDLDDDFARIKTDCDAFPKGACCFQTASELIRKFVPKQRALDRAHELTEDVLWNVDQFLNTPNDEKPLLAMRKDAEQKVSQLKNNLKTARVLVQASGRNPENLTLAEERYKLYSAWVQAIQKDVKGRIGSLFDLTLEISNLFGSKLGLDPDSFKKRGEVWEAQISPDSFATANEHFGDQFTRNQIKKKLTELKRGFDDFKKFYPKLAQGYDQNSAKNYWETPFSFSEMYNYRYVKKTAIDPRFEERWVAKCNKEMARELDKSYDCPWTKGTLTYSSLLATAK